MTRLPGADPSEVERTYRSMALAKPEDAAYFGAGEQREAARMAHGLLSISQSADGGVGEALEQALSALQSMSLASLDPGKRPWAAKIPLIGDLFDPAEEILSRHESAAAAVSRAELDLEAKARDLARSAASLKAMREENRRLLSDLSRLLEAGKRKLADLQARGPHSESAKIADKLEKRLADLEMSRLMAMQFDPQIEMMERSATEMGERIRSSVLLALPLWRQQMAIGLELFRQARLAESKARLEGELAKALQESAGSLRSIAADPSKAGSARETLKKAQSDLLSAIEGVLDEKEKARAERLAALGDLPRLEREMESRSLGAE